MYWLKGIDGRGNILTVLIFLSRRALFNNQIIS